MKKNIVLKEGIVLGLLVLFIGASVVSSISASEYNGHSSNDREDDWNIEYGGECDTTFTYANTVFVQESWPSWTREEPP